VKHPPPYLDAKERRPESTEIVKMRCIRTTSDADATVAVGEDTSIGGRQHSKAVV